VSFNQFLDYADKFDAYLQELGAQSGRGDPDAGGQDQGGLWPSASSDAVELSLIREIGIDAAADFDLAYKLVSNPTETTNRSVQVDPARFATMDEL